MRVIARLDIKNEFLIKGINLEGLRKIGNANEIAADYYSQGIDEMIYIDSVASLYSRDALLNILKESLLNIFVPITVGGGIIDLQDAENYFLNGADKIFVNTGAINNPYLINDLVKNYGSANISLSIEAKQVDKGKFNAFTSSGRDDSGLDVIDWAKEAQSRGVGEIFLTSVDNDGLQDGFNEDLINQIKNEISVPLVISGGFGQIKHLDILDDKISGIAIGSAFHYKKTSPSKVKEHLLKNNLEVRS